MERQGKSCPWNVFEKISKAFGSSPAFQTICRISHPRSASSVKTIEIQSNSKPHAVPISFDHSSQAPPKNGKPSSATPPEIIKKNTQVAKIASRKEPEAAPQNPDEGSKPKLHRENLEKGGKSGIHIEDRFTEFINSARVKLGNISHSDEGKNLSGKDNKSLCEIGHRKDHFSDYIDRTKKKLRTTSSIGGGKSKSFK